MLSCVLLCIKPPTRWPVSVVLVQQNPFSVWNALFFSLLFVQKVIIRKTLMGKITKVVSSSVPSTTVNSSPIRWSCMKMKNPRVLILFCIAIHTLAASRSLLARSQRLVKKQPAHFTALWLMWNTWIYVMISGTGRSLGFAAETVT